MPPGGGVPVRGQVAGTVDEGGGATDGGGAEAGGLLAALGELPEVTIRATKPATTSMAAEPRT